MKLSLIQHQNNNALVAWTEQGEITCATFLNDVMQLAQQLPDKKYAINLCENRYLFMVAFAAVLVRGQTNLLPQNQLTETLYAVAEDYADNYCITETAIAGLRLQQFNLKAAIEQENPFKASQDTLAVPQIAAELVAAIVFTSGSTGKPQANSKTWKALVQGAKMAAERFGFDNNPVAIVSTVPPQHMYGLETSILYSLQNTCPVYAGRPFYPDDIRRVVESAGQPVVLITTPVHLRACVTSKNLQWNNLAFVISATAPLRKEMAQQVQSEMQVSIKEIFGCTEAGSMASRETLKDQTWHLYNGIEIYKENNKIYIHAPHVGEDCILNDVVEIIDRQHFKLIGRDDDMVNIAGKRGSLSDIKLKLEAIDGVDDAAVFLPDDNNEIARLAAFVVAENLTTKQIISELANKVDSVFIPRPVYKVQRLPYNKTGKLTQQALTELYCKCKNRPNETIKAGYKGT